VPRGVSGGRRSCERLRGRIALGYLVDESFDGARDEMQAHNTEWSMALAALRGDGALGARLDEIADDLELDLGALAERLAVEGTSAFDTLFGDGDWSPRTPGQWLLGALLATRLPSWIPQDVRVAGDLDVTERRIVAGNLHVTGNLDAKSELFVLGDLTVDGFAHVVVAGDLTCGAGLFSEGALMVGGRVIAPVVALTFNQGFAKILQGVSARALLEADHGGSRIYGPVEVPVVLFDELVTDENALAPATLDDLARLLAPAAGAAIAGLGTMDAATKLVELLAAGETLFA